MLVEKNSWDEFPLLLTIFIIGSSVFIVCFMMFFPRLVLQNVKGQCPADVVPDPLDMPLETADVASVAKELWALLSQALPRPSSPLPLTLQAQAPPVLSDKARIQLSAMGLRLGDRVVIAGQKVCDRSIVISAFYFTKWSNRGNIPPI